METTLNLKTVCDVLRKCEWLKGAYQNCPSCNRSKIWDTGVHTEDCELQFLLNELEPMIGEVNND